ncbi:hypothetical protein BYT27DRAFT_7334768 [Phlegmacium glaucopus]|nr:hypothetical protein BYT27DRAFT_7334768 [Phlegmacium glaucopus]
MAAQNKYVLRQCSKDVPTDLPPIFSIMAGPDDPSDQWAMFQVRYVCYAALSFVTWEWLITLSFEVDFIWRKETPRYTKLLYCAPRYLGLISLICNAVGISYVHQIYFVKHARCQWLYAFQLLAMDIILLSLEVLLLVRIFALYDRRQRIAVFLSIMLGLKTIAVIILSIFAVRRTGFGDACLIQRSPSVVLYISVLEVLIQTFIWTATLYKHLLTCWETGWRDIPLLTLVTRDGTFTFVVLLVLYLLSLTEAISGAQHMIKMKPRPMLTSLAVHNIIFPIIMAVTSLSSCRLIMNMQTFTCPELEDDEHEGGVQLTTLYRST